jgi:CubicO group peptidase (beta-lactamase class C family)
MLVALVLFISACKTNPIISWLPQQLNDGWHVAKPKNEGVDEDRLKKMLQKVADNDYRNIHSIILAKNNKLILEAYFHGYDKDAAHDLRSATKSITSFLTGIALDKGYIPSINTPIIDYFSSSVLSQNTEKQKITVKHLLTMSSGLECNDRIVSSRGNEEKMYKKEDWVSYILNLPMVDHPGESYSYCTVGAVVLGKTIEQSTGMEIEAFSKAFLFEPLGIKNYAWASI